MLQDEVLEKANGELNRVLEHVFDAGYAVGAGSREQEIEDLKKELETEKHKVTTFKEFLKKL